MSRPRDWTALGATTDPLPGDPDAILALAGDFRRVARAICETAELLRRSTAAEAWHAPAAARFRARAGIVAGLIEHAFDRYDAAATVLTEYAPVLRDCQRHADQALATARAGVPGDLAGAHRHLTAAIADRDAAARRAAARIGLVVAHDGVHDTWKDRICAVVARIAAAASDVAFAAGSAALFLSWIPVVGPALAAGFSAVSTWAGMVALAGHLFLLLEGECDMSTVATDVIGMATAGVARSYARLSEESALSARALARSTEAARIRATEPSIDRRAVYRAVNRATGGPAGRAAGAGVRARGNATGGPSRAPASLLEPRAALRLALTGYRGDVDLAVKTAARATRSVLGGRGVRLGQGLSNGQIFTAAPATPLASALAIAGERELAADLVAASRIRPDLAAAPRVAPYLGQAQMRGAIALGGWTGGVLLGGQDAAQRLAVALPSGPGCDQ
ncbi:MAG: hypothetical protein ACQSGP_05075 [Frankia sp.]